MSESLRPRGDRCELETVTYWPLVCGAAVALLLGVAVVAAACLFAHDVPPPRRSVAEAPPAPAPKRPMVVTDLGPDPSPTTAEPPWASSSRRLTRDSVSPAKAVEADARLKARAEPSAVWSPSDRLRKQTEAEALEELRTASVELDLDAEPDSGKKLHAESLKHAAAVKNARQYEESRIVSFSSPLETLLASRKDLNGLPLLLGTSCETNPEQARTLAALSVKFRSLQERAQLRTLMRDRNRGSESQEELLAREQKGPVDPSLKEYLFDCVEGSQPTLHVRPIEQTYQTETVGMREEMVRALAKVEGGAATQAIARRAVYDASPDVRSVAVKALAARDRVRAREVFLAAFRHPWPAASQHAAEALVELDDVDATRALTGLLDEPDPTSPVKDGERWTKKRLVRVNHLRNCLLCHPASDNDSDLMHAPIPTPGEPLRGYASRSRQSVPSVRADVVYFRQDFSAMHEVEKPNKWPALQRYDYLVQTVEVPQPDKSHRQDKTYPQREAVVWALFMLKGKQLASED